ncbi:MAG: hypothetical protein II485_00635, partial [Firmicutes bacterium]|nr:hypothetical protein [Bacillota bacterium]
MAKKGKKYQEAAKLVNRAELYDVDKAFELVTKTATAKFDETVEAHFKMGLDGRHADQQIRGAIVLPNGTGKSKKVLVFAKGEKAHEAEAAGAEGSTSYTWLCGNRLYSFTGLSTPASEVKLLRSGAG